MDANDRTLIWAWANQLGLAASPLFGAGGAMPASAHFALLDGRSGSFACSVGDTVDVGPDDSRNWQWSADLAHHVLVASSEVRVRSGRDSLSRRFSRSSVEQNLEAFFRFLDTPRHSGLPDIVPFLIDEFLQMWGSYPGNEPAGHSALSAFLIAILAAGEQDPRVYEDLRWRKEHAVELGFDDEDLGRLDALPAGMVARAVSLQTRAPSGLKVVPELVLRHAAGRLFQEAHAYLEGAQFSLFGDSIVSTTPRFSPTGAYFTPLVLARSVAENALSHFDSLPSPISIADFACGSAIFLTEALRVLERRGFSGTVRLVGRDISPEAITMARVAIATAARGLPGVTVVADLAKVDALEVEQWPYVDVVLMNPPFRSWEQMPSSERVWVRSTLVETARGRPDLSVGFTERAIAALKPEGVLGILLPAGVLASEGLTSWRASLIERATPKLVAVLGEHGLFRQATVNVALLVLKKSINAPEDTGKLNLAWASTDPGAASEALRAIRRISVSTSEVESGNPIKRSHSWNVMRTTVTTLRERPSWLPGTGSLGGLLDAIRESVGTRVETLFYVHQGIRTGANPVFVIDRTDLNRLPPSEKLFFKPVVDAGSFKDGNIVPNAFLFVPSSEWNTEADVKDAVPTYFSQFLHPFATELKGRKGLSRLTHWWELTRARKWSESVTPRLVSKRFGLYPAFARDFGARFAVVQANAWIPKSRLLPKASDKINEETRELLTTYWWLLNSRIAVLLFREFCPNVAGGQLDLEHKYVRHVPIPDLKKRIENDPGLQSLAMEIRERNGDSLPQLEERDSFAAVAYGTSLSDWPLSSVRHPKS